MNLYFSVFASSQCCGYIEKTPIGIRTLAAASIQDKLAATEEGTKRCQQYLSFHQVKYFEQARHFTGGSHIWLPYILEVFFFEATNKLFLVLLSHELGDRRKLHVAGPLVNGSNLCVTIEFFSH